MKTKTNSCDIPSLQRRQILQGIGAAATLPFLGVTKALAQDPDTVRIVVPFPAGSPVEAHTRVFAEALKKTTGRNYVVDNKPGAGGMLGAAEVARAKPDGSVLLYITASHTSGAALYPKLPFDPIQDLTPISKMALAPGLALLVRANSPFRTVQDLIKAAQEKPKTISYASLGNGQTSHILGELFGREVKAQFVHVPYRTSPMPDVIGGHVEFTWLGTSVALPLVKGGQVRVLAVSNRNRIPEAPDAPTFAELGIKADVPAWTGMLGPRGMPLELANRIHRDLVQASKQPEYLAYVKVSGNEIVMTSPREFATEYVAEIERYRRILPQLGIKMDVGG
jgi:tripartite-type tricarboxylate transporter receptor subunit TctC